MSFIVTYMMDLTKHHGPPQSAGYIDQSASLSYSTPGLGLTMLSLVSAWLNIDNSYTNGTPNMVRQNNDHFGLFGLWPL